VTRVAALVCQNRMVRSRCRTDVSGKAHLNGVHTRLGPWRSEKAPGGPAAMRNRLFAIIALCIELGSGVAVAGLTSRVSVRSSGAQANGSSTLGSMTPDGRFVAFVSSAPNLVPGDANGREDVFVHDRMTGATERVSVASDGSEGHSIYYPMSASPALSADGRFVAFSSIATGLVPDDTNATWDVFVHDRMTGTTERVSVASDGSQVHNGIYSCDGSVSISADGRYVAFTSDAPTLVPGDTNNRCDVFVHDRATGATERVSVASDGSEADGDSSQATISGDGAVVAFRSGAGNLVPGDTNSCPPFTGSCPDIFVNDRTTGITERINVASDGTQANAESFAPAVSSDAGLVAFASYATNLVSGGSPGYPAVFLRDRSSSLTTRVADTSLAPALSGDGRFLTFISFASDLVPADTNGQCDVFVDDRASGTTTRVSVASDGSESDVSAYPSVHRTAVSSDGRFVAFTMDDGNLVRADANHGYDVLVHDRDQTCGNGVQEDDEQCDDGNLVDGDGCESDCTVTLCRGGTTINAPRVKLSRLIGEGEFPPPLARILFTGRLVFPPGAPSTYDPRTTGVQVSIEDVGEHGAAVFDLTFRTDPVPPGTAGCTASDGWRPSASATEQTYRNGSTAMDPPVCTPGSANGLTSIKFKDLRARSGEIAFKVRAVNSILPRPGGYETLKGPLRTTIVLGATAADGLNGACGVHAFSPEQCAFNGGFRPAVGLTCK